jgi:DNA-binding transcriptional LysR family regulator
VVQRSEQQLQGWLRVAASVGFGRLKLMPIIQQILLKHSTVKIDLVLNDGFIDLVERGIDVSVRIGDLANAKTLPRCVNLERLCRLH